MKSILIAGSSGKLALKLNKLFRRSYRIDGIDLDFSIDTVYRKDLTNAVKLDKSYHSLLHMARHGVISDDVYNNTKNNLLCLFNSLESVAYSNFIYVNYTNYRYLELEFNIIKDFCTKNNKTFSFVVLSNSQNIEQIYNILNKVIDQPSNSRIDIEVVESKFSVVDYSIAPKQRILFIKPRLDLPFQAKVTDKFKSDPDLENKPLRKFWAKFLDISIQALRSRSNNELEILQIPLYQLGTRCVDINKYDIVYVPHKEVNNFKLSNIECRYYMQTSLPWLFSIDRQGWASNTSVYPYDQLFKSTTDYKLINLYRNLITSNQSKFEQPEYKELNLPKDYVLFTCQIPTDYVITNHSKVGVSHALIATCEATAKLNIPLVVKGHPLRLDLMKGLRLSVEKYKHVTWINTASIHQTIASSIKVVTVNSGTGMEALIHGKPVITFGNAEYDCVTTHANRDNIVSAIEQAGYDEERTSKFFDAYTEWCYDVNDLDSFLKL